MPRITDAATLNTLTASNLQPAIFVQLTFANATAYIWSGSGSFTWGGNTYLGLGAFLGFADIEDGDDVNARGVEIIVSGIDATLLPDCMGEYQLGLPAAVYLGFFSGGALVATPIAAWTGRMDQPEITIPGDSATISIRCENRLIDMNVARERRRTTEDQQMNWPGDQGLSFADGIQETTIVWGMPITTNNI
ncbi:MAG TPA: hypothetical protein VMB85_13855 [Bryobacteraceae bacterium]|nr:hypothetical protein [Bryobacteraceae bacterium]